MPEEQIKAWIGLWRRSSRAKQVRITRQWPRLYRKLKTSNSTWACVNGPIAATIATLLDLRWKPITPTRWLTPEGLVGDFMKEPGISQHEILHKIHQQLEHQLWQHASTAFGGKGLDTGMPTLMPASKAHSELTRKGKYVEAKALEHVVTNKVWSGERL